MDTSKTQQAIAIIASQIKNLPANKDMAYGTVGASLGMTERQGQAYSMALQFVKMLGGDITPSLNRTAEQDEACKMVDEITAAAIEIVGK